MNWQGPLQSIKNAPAFYAGLLFFILSVTALLWGGLKVSDWLQQQQTVPVRQVKLYGDFTHIRAAELHQRLEQQYIGNFFNVHVDQVQDFMQQQPWVYQVAVRKQWPDTLVVVVKEQQPVAIWNSQQLLNKQGEVFTAPLEQLIPVLPELLGPRGSEQDALTMFRHMQTLLAAGQFSIETLGVTERFSWQIQLKNGIALKLGREDTLKRVQRFIDLYPVIKQHSTEQVAEVDLRYDTGIAVKYTSTEAKKA